MTIADPKFDATGVSPIPLGAKTHVSTNRPRYHRIATVRRQQGVSLRSASRQMRVDTRVVQSQEDESSDLRLSDLYRWEALLGVPVCELLLDSGTELSRPVQERAKMVRIMKTVKSMLETATNSATRRLAETLVDQLVDLMPELKDVSPWHSVGQRRSLNEFGRAAERIYRPEPPEDDSWDT